MADAPAPNDPNRNDRRGLFDVLAHHSGRILLAFYVIWLSLAALLTCARILAAENPPLTWPEIAIIVIVSAAMTVVIALPAAFGIMEGIPMVFAKLYTDRVREAALAEGREEGREEGRDESNRLWREWNRRRVQAEHDGVAFDEPAPDADVAD